jgi:hypothetical protein
MTPSPLPVATAAAGGVPDWVPIAALVISLLAFIASGLNSWVNLRNRADKNSVWLTLVKSTKTEPYSVIGVTGSRTVYRRRTRWTLHNAGEGTISAPSLTLTLNSGDAYAFTADQPLLGKSMIEVVPVDDLPTGDGDEIRMDLVGATAEASWRAPNGKGRTEPVMVTLSWTRSSASGPGAPLQRGRELATPLDKKWLVQ